MYLDTYQIHIRSALVRSSVPWSIALPINSAQGSGLFGCVLVILELVASSDGWFDDNPFDATHAIVPSLARTVAGIRHSYTKFKFYDEEY
jgi:hypothetical protein